MATNSNQLVNGACIAAGAALAIADFPLIGAAIAAVGAYRAVKDGTNPLAAVSLFAWDTVSGFKGMVQSEQAIVTAPVQAVAGALFDQAQSSLVKFEFRAGGTQELGTDWLADLADSGNVGVLGDQGEGKSFILRYLAYRFVERHGGNCRVYIHDIEDGQGHGAKHSWFGWPRGSVVFTAPDELPAIIQEIDQAIDTPDFLPTLLLVDELNNCLDELDTDQIGITDQGLKRIRNRGKKRGIHFAFGTQDVNVADLGLNRAAIKKLSWIVLPKMAGSPGNFANLDLSDEAKAERKAAYAQLKALDKSEGIYPALLYHNRHWSLRGIPELSWLPETIELLPPEQGQPWLVQFFSIHPDFEHPTFTSARKLTDAINEILRSENEPLIQRTDTDTRYQEVKAWLKGGRGGSAQPTTDNQ